MITRSQESEVRSQNDQRRTPAKTFRDLVVWRKAHKFVLMKFAKYSDTSGVAPASCRHRRMPPGRRRYDEGLSPYFANISNIACTTIGVTHFLSDQTDVCPKVLWLGEEPGVCAANYVDLPCPLPPISREGFRKRGRADKVRYMNIAEGSIEECRYYLILAEDLGYGETKDLMEMLEEVSRLLNAYSKAILSSDS